jgi:hypothetical protein
VGGNPGGAGSMGAAGNAGGAGTAGAAGAAGATGAAGAAGAAGATGAAGAAGTSGAAGATGAAGAAGTSGAAGAAGAAGSTGAAGNGVGGAAGTTDGGVDAAPAVCGTGTACGADLSNIGGTADFCISFTLNTKQTQGETAILNQRSTCGFSNFWDIRAGLGAADAGASASWLEFESDVDSSNNVSVGSPPNPFVVVLNDGHPHAVLVKRTSGVLTISVDGTSKVMATVATPFGALPALAQGTDVCDGVDGTHALSGTLVDVCITH